MPYQEFINTKLPMFDGVRYLIVEMRCISDVEVCFYTCAFPANVKFRYAQNLLRHATKTGGTLSPRITYRQRVTR